MAETKGFLSSELANTLTVVAFVLGLLATLLGLWNARNLVIAGESLEGAEVAVQTAQEDPEIAALNKTVAGLNTKIADLETKIAALSAPPPSPEPANK